MIEWLLSIRKIREGKVFGNEVADFIGMHRSLYHAAMEEGGCKQHMIKLYHLKILKMSLREVAINSCQYLLPGLKSLENRFGEQEKISTARDNVMNCINYESEDNFVT